MLQKYYSLVVEIWLENCKMIYSNMIYKWLKNHTNV